MPSALRFADPAPAPLETYGALAFLAGFCPRMKWLTVREIESALYNPAIFGMTRIFRDDTGVPRAGVTFGYFNEACEARFIAGEELRNPDDLQSGQTLWFTNLIAPFGGGAGLALSIIRGTGGRALRYPRYDATGRIGKVVECAPRASGRMRLETFDLNAYRQRAINRIEEQAR